MSRKRTNNRAGDKEKLLRVLTPPASVTHVHTPEPATGTSSSVCARTRCTAARERARRSHRERRLVEHTHTHARAATEGSCTDASTYSSATNTRKHPEPATKSGAARRATNAVQRTARASRSRSDTPLDERTRTQGRTRALQSLRPEMAQLSVYTNAVQSNTRAQA